MRDKVTKVDVMSKPDKVVLPGFRSVYFKMNMHTKASLLFSYELLYIISVLLRENHFTVIYCYMWQPTIYVLTLIMNTTKRNTIYSID